MARGDTERRNKGKDKRRNNKKFPYKKGGGKRSSNISLSSKESKKGK